MDLSSALESLGHDGPERPAVIVRLHVMAADEETGEPRLVSSLMRRSAMPLALASSNVCIALELQGERRVFKPTQVTWDETVGVCIVEVEWLVTTAAHAEAQSEAIEDVALWPA